eukprot:6174593-Pleurochrysis_carterae.AAC.2
MPSRPLHTASPSPPSRVSRSQVGMASDRATYIHRLGRTARAGKQGGGVLLLADFEKRFLDTLDDLPIRKA